MADHQYKTWVSDLIDDIKKHAEKYEQLTRDRVRLENEKLILGGTDADREDEFKDGISKINIKLKGLSSNIKSKGKLVHDYELEYDSIHNVVKVFNVNGMKGQSCITNIRLHVGTLVGKIRSIKSVQVLLNQKQVKVGIDADKTSENAIIDIISHLGFQVEKWNHDFH